jgi:8-oxo-dGTP pyrophosphatase MutT (NUDIX family)
MDGKTPEQCALIEAWEEAGVRGKVTGGSLGLFSYLKEVTPKKRQFCAAMVYPVKVKSLEDRFPEAKERRRKWMRPKKAAAKVQEPELAEILRRFDPKALPAVSIS